MYQNRVANDCISSSEEKGRTSEISDELEPRKRNLNTKGYFLVQDVVSAEDINALTRLIHTKFLKPKKNLIDNRADISKTQYMKKTITKDGNSYEETVQAIKQVNRLQAFVYSSEVGEWKQHLKEVEKIIRQVYGQDILIANGTEGMSILKNNIGDPSVDIVPEQVLHTDFGPRHDTELEIDKKENSEKHTELPGIAVVTLCDNTQFNVCPGLINHGWKGKKLWTNRLLYEKMQTLNIAKAGSLLIFRGDLVHAGSESNLRSERLHIPIGVKPVSSSTFTSRTAGDPSNRDRIRLGTISRALSTCVQTTKNGVIMEDLSPTGTSTDHLTTPNQVSDKCNESETTVFKSRNDDRFKVEVTTYTTSAMQVTVTSKNITNVYVPTENTPENKKYEVVFDRRVTSGNVGLFPSRYHLLPNYRYSVGHLLVKTTEGVFSTLHKTLLQKRKPFPQ
jgi:hypothetical protein